MKFLTQKSTAFLLLVLSAATGLLLLTFSHNLMFYWLFGLGFGIILQRSHICFVSAASDPIYINCYPDCLLWNLGNQVPLWWYVRHSGRCSCKYSSGSWSIYIRYWHGTCWLLLFRHVYSNG